MTTPLNSALLPHATSAAAFPRSAGALSLAALPLGQRGCIVAVAGTPDDTAWLAAVGIGRGEELVVLRRAIFGGPLHVRTQAGGEFALDRSLADGIRVEPIP